MLISILGFLAILGPLVIFHEFGHYIFARIFGVKAEIFSVGFGPVLWRKQLGETELRISAVPLGGFVKLLGEEPDRELTEAEKVRSLGRQPAWKRFFIFFGGPLFNLILAVLVFMIILVLGEPQIASVVGRSVHGSAAERAGFRNGDQIVEVDGRPVHKFEEVIYAVNDHPEKPLEFKVVHPGETSPVVVMTKPTTQDGFSVYGEATHVGEIDGLLHTARSNLSGISDPASPAGKAGIKTGEKVTAIDGKPTSTWEQVENLYRSAKAGSPMVFKVGSKEVTLTKPQASSGLGDDLGLWSNELFVEKAMPGTPAEAAGIRAGDRLVKIGEQKVNSFFELKDSVQRAGEHDGKVNVTWERAGKLQAAMITPTATNGRDPILKKVTQYTIGVMPMLIWAEPTVYIERIYNPITLVYKATYRMAVFSWRNLVSIIKMVKGDVSTATLGGPILIGKIAGEAISRGLIAFLSTMAILSVGLGVLNLLPVPVLDGGHLLLLAIEAIRGKALTIRQTEIVQQVGLAFIVLLMVVVIRNDLARLPFFE